MEEVCFRYISSCCDKILHQTQLNRGRAHVGSQMSQSIMVGRSEQQEIRAAGHVTSKVKEQGGMGAGAQFTFSSFSSLGPQPQKMVL